MSEINLNRPTASWIIATKLVSGKFILTVVASICFLIIVKSLTDILISKSNEVNASQIILLLSNLALVIQNVFNSYFSKKRIENSIESLNDK